MKNDSAYLLVPIHVDALTVAADDTRTWKDLSLNTDTLKDFDKYHGLGCFLEKDVTSPGIKGNLIMPAGIHLHWVFPDALRHGEHDKETDDINFPKVPDRWIVIRTDEDQLANTTAWMVESDYITSQGQQPENNVDIPATSNVINVTEGSLVTMQPVRMGRVLPLSGWTEQNAASSGLTVMMPGNPEFAASYPNSRCIFGLHDDMLDNKQQPLPHGNYTYMIFGWYANIANCPFNDVQDNKGLLAKLKEFNWLLNEADDLTGTIPNNILCHAMVSGINWNKNVTISSIPNIGSVSIGNTVSEALAVLMKNSLQNNPDNWLYKLSLAWQYKMIQNSSTEKTSPDDLRKQLHSKNFVGVNGGNYWVAHKADNTADATGMQEANIVPLQFDTTTSAALQKLNALQKNFDETAENLKAAQSELYADEYKAKLTNTDSTISGVEITNQKQSFATLQQQIQNAADQLQKDLASANKLDNSGVVIKKVPMPKYFKPGDPAIAITNMLTDSSNKYLDKQSITCRITNQLVSIINFLQAVDDVIESDNDLKNVSDFIDNRFPAEIRALLNEYLILNPANNQRVINTINVLTNREIQGLDFKPEYYCAEQNSANSSQTPAILPEEFSKMKWQQPWLPLHLEWSLQWASTYTFDHADTALNGWSFDDLSAVDYSLQDTNLPADAITYSGRTLIALNTGNKINALNKSLSEIDKNRYTDQFFKDMKPVAQTLSGFTDQLLTRFHGIQLHLLNNKGESETDNALIENQYSWRPISNTKFYPVRSGLFQLTMLRITDAFGQVLDIPVKQLQNVSSLKTNEQPGNQKFILPPRIIQPARLRFDWMSANNTVTDSNPATTPVCGWFLHNKLNNSISVFDASGNAAGEIAVGGETVSFNTVSGSGNLSARLNNAIQFIIKNGRDCFNGLVAQMDAISKNALPNQTRQRLIMSLPVGYPVALVSAQCLLELQGPLAKDYSGQLTDTAAPLKDISFKIFAGSNTSKADGLIGYFANDNYEVFNVPGMNFEEKYFNKTNFITVNAGDSLSLTLLMDPRMGIHLTMGILPAAYYEIPSYLVEQPLQKISFSFLTAPVLTPVSTLKMPLLQNKEIEWQLTTAGNNSLTPDPNTKGTLKFEPLHIIEGWLKVNPKK